MRPIYLFFVSSCWEPFPLNVSELLTGMTERHEHRTGKQNPTLKNVLGF